MFRKQDRDDLNKAILEYLYDNGYNNAYEAFIEDANIDISNIERSERKVLEK